MSNFYFYCRIFTLYYKKRLKLLVFRGKIIKIFAIILKLLVLNIWGGISFKGPTEFPCFTNNMDALHYRQIICDFLFPFIAANYSIYEVVLHQDNDPKHSSLLCKGILEINGVNWVNFLLH